MSAWNEGLAWRDFFTNCEQNTIPNTLKHNNTVNITNRHFQAVKYIIIKQTRRTEFNIFISSYGRG